jgi:3-deoxy-7-phosphoheptulonate synthase
MDDVAFQVAAGDRRIVGVMVESHLMAGRQDLKPGVPLVYGQSITDGCIDWDASEAVLERLAEAVKVRRQRAAKTGSGASVERVG